MRLVLHDIQKMMLVIPQINPVPLQKEIVTWNSTQHFAHFVEIPPSRLTALSFIVLMIAYFILNRAISLI